VLSCGAGLADERARHARGGWRKRSRWAAAIWVSEANEDMPASDRERGEGFQFSSVGVASMTASERGEGFHCLFVPGRCQSRFTVGTRPI